MERKPLVSVITPCYNGEKFIHNYFESILKQTYSNIELIFVDDGSTDKTKEIALSYSQQLENKGIDFAYIYQEHSGQARAINKGLQRISGKYLIWPDSDDVISPDSIQKRVAFLEKNTEYQFVRSNGDYFDYQSKKIISRISNSENRFHPDIFEDLILENTFCSCGCYMVKVEKLKEIYPDLTIYESQAGQNWQLLIPFSGRFFCGYIDEDLYHIAVREESHSRQNRTLEQQIQRYMELKEILLEGVEKAHRYEKDYISLIDVKYQRIFLQTYIEHDDLVHASKFFNLLKNQGHLDDYIRCQFLAKFYPHRFKVCEGLRKVENILKRLRIMIGERNAV